MNKKLVFIEPPHFLIPIFEKFSKEYNDELFLISNHLKNYSGKNYFNCDVRENIDEARSYIRNTVINPDAIVTSTEMFLTQTAELNNEFNLRGNSIETILNCRDKAMMKIIWNEKNIPTPQSNFFRSKSELLGKADSLNYPVIIKPSLGYASCGVRKVNDKEELLKQMNKILLFNSTVIAREKLNDIGFLVEQYIDGDEYSIDTIWLDGKPLCDGIMSKGNAKGPYFPDLLYFVDPNIESEDMQTIVNTSHNAVLAMGMNIGASHTELRIMDGNPYIIETTCRPGAGGMFFYLFEKSMGLEFYRIYYLTYLYQDANVLLDLINKPVKYSDKYYFLYNIPYPIKGIIKEINGVDELKKQKDVLQAMCFKDKGSVIYESDMNAEYLCWILGEADISIGKNDIHNYVKKFDNALEVIV
ncbi:MAG: ATP-grasp domain-containing protein [Ignavibacteriaceae bacterium]|nr:ATP-grasp domain-containing protein [Ignavibacteriaceae bacterium]